MRFRKNKSGNITPIFCLLVFVLLGGISYSLYVGQMVSDRMAEQTAVDAASLSAANHVAQGLNMISANNLSIGAAVQVAGSVSNLALYIGTFRALFISLDELPTASGFGVDSPAQKSVYQKMSYVSMPFLRTASGLTRLNQGVYQYWQYMTPIRAVEVSRMNIPGSIAVAIPMSGLGTNENSKLYQFDGMLETKPKSTICKAYKAGYSDNAGDQGILQMANWMSSPFASLTTSGGDGFGKVFSILEGVANLVKKFPVFIDISRTGNGCGINLKFGVGAFFDVPKAAQRLGFPKRIGRQLGKEFNLVSHGDQAGHLAATVTATENSFGFLVPDVITDPQVVSPFEKSLEYAVVLMNPLRSAKQLNPANCPTAWKRGGTCDGVGLASMVDEGLKKKVQETDSSGNNVLKDSDEVAHEINLASGGLHRELGAQGAMNGTMSRMKFRMAQAKAVFRPSENGKAAMANKSREKQHQSTFWPGWEGALTHATLLTDVLKKITDLTGKKESEKK